MKALIITAGNGYHITGSYNLSRLKNAFESKGIDTRYFGIGSGSASLDDITDIPDIAYIGYMLTPDKLAEAQRFRDKGVFFVNSPETVALCSDKISIYNKLIDANIAHPKTQILNDNTNFDSLDLGWPCVIKPNNQSEGTGSPCAGLDVLLCDDSAELKFNFDMLSLKYSGTNTQFMAQEYIESGNGDMMVSSWIFGDVVSSFISIADPTESDLFKSHRAVGHERIPIETPENLLQFIRQIAIVLDAEIFRIETFYSNGVYKVCKIKTPGDRLVHDATMGIDSSQLIADYIIRRYNAQ